jgi:hypothetical protein
MRSLILVIFLSLHAQLAWAQPEIDAFSWQDKLQDAIAPRRTIDTSTLGVNAFANDARFGNIESQFNEVKNELGIRYIRILMNWDDNVQPTPTSKPNFSFYDELVKNIPPGTEALVVLTSLPSWMQDSNNWLSGDPRKTFAKKWVKKVAKRYARKGRVKAFQIWNEPNDIHNPHNLRLGLAAEPKNYVALLQDAAAEVRRYAPKKRLVAAATTAINQNFPDTLEYNESLRDQGIESIADVVAIHYYGAQYERKYLGVGAFIESIQRPIWVTESGQRGVLKQLEYAERTFPFLKALSPRIQRIYAYQFTDERASSDSWGLRTLDPEFPISDLYLHLRDRN